jgi:cysteine desulfurase family protein (TIGR01976 family)
MLDVDAVRAQFPALAMTLTDGRFAVFLDNPAGTQVPRMVVDAIASYLTSYNANTGGAFVTSRRSDAAIASAHQAAADYLGASDPSSIIFGANMTTLTFALSRAIGRTLGPGDEILCTVLDHDANIAPWLALEEDRGIRVEIADMNPSDGTLDLTDLERKLSPRTRLVAATYASNALGTINDVTRIVKMAHSVDAVAWIDAVHYAPHGLIDVGALDCDFLVCSAYKFFGPHVGIAYGKREHLERLRPYKVRPADDVIPDRWETGTLNHEGLAGVNAAVDYVASLSSHPQEPRRARIRRAMADIHDYERGLTDRLVGGLTSVDGLKVYGITDPARFEWRVPTVACTLEGYTPRQVAEHLGDEGIFVWDGDYYALEVMQRLGLSDSGGALRIGPVHYNTPGEIDRLLNALHGLAEARGRSTVGVRP